ncbi:lipoarabinomannan carrier protein LprG [Mycolicibacterium chitae]|uniref:Lipoprotein lprG n=1 Tax=Mycolicibacterium chitae TaxID=1792 RepID=A0A448I752_MYCCI|nr:LppX_LprAFG lipoprotein [Mycolicibacterium chitae]MCV7107624.1 LppX_LprAFG lipoprotein [Mycolicibacterium chitae]BBZ04728.1 lipoarabinomannan carrier protein LprG [Mycolicibacterium chitae]VEG48357.1 lipoprotein lprG [Mycolicibacterium chitae]
MQPRRLVSRIVLSLAAAGAATALVVGCSSGSDAPAESLPDAPGLLQQSSQTTKGLQSAHLEILVDGTIEGLPVKQLSGDLTNVPATAVQGSAKITMAGSDVDVDLVVIDSTLFAALTPDSWLDMGPAADIYDPSTILNPEAGVANILANFSDAKSEGTEQIDGIDTVRVTGEVSADAVNQLIPSLKATSPVPGTAWIENGGDHNLVRAQIEPTGDSSIELTLSKWNEPVTVTKPQV